MMTRGLRGMVVLMALCIGVFLRPSGRVVASAQVSLDAEYSRIEHANSSATLSVLDASRPLLAGLTTVREEYGWRVDVEEPPHESFPRGGKFESTYPESPDIYVSSASEASILNKIVSDYNQAGFPGQYSVIAQSDGSYAVVGTAMQNAAGTYQPVTPILDTPISIPNGNGIAGSGLL